jgi:hypothetical protein
VSLQANSRYSSATPCRLAEAYVIARTFIGKVRDWLRMGNEGHEGQVGIATGCIVGVCFPAEARNFLLFTDPGQPRPASSEHGTRGCLGGDKVAGA